MWLRNRHRRTLVAAPTPPRRIVRAGSRVGRGEPCATSMTRGRVRRTIGSRSLRLITLCDARHLVSDLGAQSLRSIVSQPAAGLSLTASVHPIHWSHPSRFNRLDITGRWGWLPLRAGSDDLTGDSVRAPEAAGRRRGPFRVRRTVQCPEGRGLFSRRRACRAQAQRLAISCRAFLWQHPDCGVAYRSERNSALVRTAIPCLRVFGSVRSCNPRRRAPCIFLCGENKTVSAELAIRGRTAQRAALAGASRGGRYALLLGFAQRCRCETRRSLPARGIRAVGVPARPHLQNSGRRSFTSRPTAGSPDPAARGGCSRRSEPRARSSAVQTPPIGASPELRRRSPPRARHALRGADR